MFSDRACHRIRTLLVHTVAAAGALALFAADRAGGVRVAAAGPIVPLAVVANTANPVGDLTSAQLRDLFLGRQTTWSNGRRVTVVLRQDMLERAAIIRLCCNMTPEEYDRHMLRAVFAGELASGPKLVSSDEAVKKFVFNVPGALGAIAATDLDSSVRPVRIDGRLPRDSGYRLVIP